MGGSALIAQAKIDPGDTAWVLTATALVIMMTPALGLFYAGLVRAKSTLNTFMMCIAALAVATVAWAAVGYSLAFDGNGGFIGGGGKRVPARGHVRPARRHHHPPARLLRVPGELLHRHGGARLRGSRRADALRPV